MGSCITSLVPTDMASLFLPLKLTISFCYQGILISGPPGTGKTLLARAIARESGLPFVFASGAEFVESSTGNGSDKIFDIFFTARANVRTMPPSSSCFFRILYQLTHVQGRMMLLYSLLV